MRYHYGYTNIDVIGAVVIVFTAMLIVAMFANPVQKFEFEQDEVLADGVRDYMEAKLELEENDPEVFWEIAFQVYEKEVSVGACTQCVDVSSYLVPDYIEALPTDLDGGYTEDKTGYYFLFEDDVLEIGANSPHGDLPIRLLWFVKEIE